MKFKYNGKKYEYPNSLSKVTLGQRIDFQNKYGNAHEKRIENVSKIEDAETRELELADINVQYFVESFSFFTGIPLESVKAEFDLGQIMNVVQANAVLLTGEEKELETLSEYEFNDETFVIEAPELSPQHKMTFNEFLLSKELTRQLQQLGKGKMDALLYLCAIYLRKKGEPFDESLVAPESERMELFKSLPLDVAFGVGFFLTNSIDTFQKTLQSLKEVKVEKGLT